MALPTAATHGEHSICQKKRQIVGFFSNPSNISVSMNDTIVISLGVRRATFFISFGFQLYLFI